MTFESNLYNGYTEAYRIASDILSDSDPAKVCQRAGVTFDHSSSTYYIKYINRDYFYSNETGRVFAPPGNKQPTITESILVLHYLVNASGKGSDNTCITSNNNSDNSSTLNNKSDNTSNSSDNTSNSSDNTSNTPNSSHSPGEYISFREIPGAGNIYYPAFKKRAIDPLVKTFADEPSKLIRASSLLGGITLNIGTASVALDILPYITVFYTVWQGDEEVPPSGTILFRKNIISLLPGEDITVAASFGVYELIATAKTIVSGGNL